MDSAIDLLSQAPVEGDNWDVYRDAFAPPQDTRRPKAWERASVPAHAPRLHGQKIWKRAGIQIRNNKENEAALFELQSEGNGARKKRKVWAVKESIRDAPWKSGSSGTESLDYGENNMEVDGEDIAAIRGRDDGKDDALRFIPRKRTNTDHVITPKKPLRQTQLNGQAWTIQVRSDETLVDKPPRRRKSMRKSIRKSTSAKLAEAAIFTSSQGFASGSETYTGAIQSDGATESVPETVPEMTLIHPTSVGGSGSMEDVGREEARTLKGTNIERGRRRAISPRYSRRSTRNSMSMSSIAEDPAAQYNSPVKSQLVSHVASQNFSDTSISEQSMAQAVNDPSTTATVGKVQNEVRSGTIEDAIQPEVPTTDYLEEPLTHQLDQHIPSPTQQTELLDNLPLVESTPTIQEPSEQQVLAIEPYAAAVHTITSPIVSLDEEAPEVPQPELAEHVEEPFCQPVDKVPADAFPASSQVNATVQMSLSQTEDQTPQLPENLKNTLQPDGKDSLTLDVITVAAEESPAGDQSTSSEFSQSAPANAPSAGYEDDDTDMLRNFLTRAKASKAAKVESTTPQRKRSLPHSPLRIPLGDVDVNTSPSPLKPSDEFDVSLPPSPAKRRKRHESTTDKDDDAEQKTIRRSGRTRLPVMKTTPAVPSLIPVRRLGQDGDTTITLRRNEDKELAALTRVNTRKNKGGAMLPIEVLILKAEEKTDPVLKQRLLKEMFEEKKKGNKSEKSKYRKSVTWATELTQFQSEIKDGKNKDKDKPSIGSSSGEKRKGIVTVGRPKSNITVGKPVNGTPGPKRRTKDRA